jgi:hypothetical protein
MSNDRALEVAVAVMHQLRQGQRPYLPYTEIVEVIHGLEELRFGARNDR